MTTRKLIRSLLRRESDVQDDERPGRPIEEWMEAQTGKPADEVTIADIQRLPRRSKLAYAPLTSPLGGRLDRHLAHLEDDESTELLNDAEQFLAETPAGSDEKI